MNPGQKEDGTRILVDAPLLYQPQMDVTVTRLGLAPTG
jgi:hypothetical protein